MFIIYFKLGLKHIADITAYDHILFILVLCAPYGLQHWKRLLGLITAFTIGHCITLILAGLKIVVLPSYWVELMIPLTIIATAFVNLFSKNGAMSGSWKYLLTLGFGLIHGLGFSNFFRGLLGKDTDIVMPLFAFNLGIELGQLLIIAVVLLIGLIATLLPFMNTRRWNLLCSGTAILLSIYLFISVLQG